MKVKFLTKGNIVLFLIAMAVTFITALVCSLCGAERLTVLFSGPMGGILGVLIIGGLYEICNKKAPMGPDPGILGVIAGTLVNILVF